MPADLPILRPLPSAQSPLLDGAPTTIIAAPATSLPEAGDSTMPVATRPVPATTPVLTPEQTAPPGSASDTAPSAAAPGTPASVTVAPGNSAQP